MTSKRKAIYNKYNGHCGYCGTELKMKDMQIDHIYPQRLKHFLGKGGDAPEITSIHDPTNLMPSCRSCNHYKGGSTLEGFRKTMHSIHQRMERDYKIKVGIRFGLVKIIPFDGQFYFEKLTS